MRPLAVLRPEPGASSTVRRAEALGLKAFAIPLFVVEPVVWDVPDPQAFDGLLLTSANAIRHAGSQLAALEPLPVHAVGPATAAVARAGGLRVATVGNAGVEDLLRSLPSGLRLLHLCGKHRRAPPLRGQFVTPLPVYRSANVANAADLDRLAGAVVLVHSPRAGTRLAELARERRRTVIAAISAAAAEVCGPGWQQVAVAEHPNDDAMLSLAACLCEQPDPE